MTTELNDENPINPNEPVEHELPPINLDNAIEELTPHEDQAIQLLALLNNVNIVRTNFRRISGLLRGSTEREMTFYNLSEKHLEQLFSPNMGFKKPASKESKASAITSTLRNLLTTYPQHSDELFKGYKRVFTTNDGREKITFAESNIEGFARKFEHLIVFASQLKGKGIAAPQNFEDLYAQAIQSGAYRP